MFDNLFYTIYLDQMVCALFSIMSWINELIKIEIYIYHPNCFFNANAFVLNRKKILREGLAPYAAFYETTNFLNTFFFSIVYYIRR